ncbi:1444_t:CDS:1, partial [Dentiscutata heterogama]
WDCTSGSPIRHFVPQPGNQKDHTRWDCRTSLANRWIANSALCASSGNQEMANEREATM